jgi:uncharacterized membrane protein YgaE (UPF0421/DUF939 family)
MMNKIVSFLQQSSIVWKTSLASGAAWEMARLAGSKHPYLAPLAVILCLQTTADQSVRFAFQRLIGTVLGVMLTASVAHLLGQHSWSIALLILVGAGLAKGIKLSDTVIRQIALSVLFVLVFESEGQEYAWARIRDTFIGAAAALALSLLMLPPNFTKTAIHSCNACIDRLSASFLALSRWLEHGCEAAEGRGLRQSLEDLSEQLEQLTRDWTKAQSNLRFLLLARKSQAAAMAPYEPVLAAVRQAYGHTANMTRTLAEWSETGRLGRRQRLLWAKHAASLAAMIAAWKRTLASRGADSFAVSVPIVPPEQMSPQSFTSALYHEARQLVDDLRRALL